MTEIKQSPIVIIGSGAFGISSAWHLAQAGFTNIKVLDKGDYDNNLYNPLFGADGASTDFNKLVRASYVDKVHYQDLALESLHQYYTWNDQIKHAAFLPKGLSNEDELFKHTGYIRYDDIDTGEEKRTLAHFEERGLRAYEYDINNPEDIERSKITGWYSKLDPLQQFGKVKTLSGTFHSLAGVAHAKKCLLWLRYLSERTGNVEFIYGPRRGHVTSIEYDGRKAKAVLTADGKRYPASYVVVATGAWIPQFLPINRQERVETVGTTFVLAQIPKDRQDLLDKYRGFPMINWRMSYEGSFRRDAVGMFPATDEGILKLSIHDTDLHYFVKQKGTNRLLSVPTQELNYIPRESLEGYKKFFTQWMPDLVEAGVKIEKAVYRFDGVDQRNEFIIDFVPEYDNVVVAGGGSYHGFKFLPVLGRFVKGLITGKRYKFAEKFKFDAIPEKEYTASTQDINDPYTLNTAELVKSRPEYYTFKPHL